MDYALVCMDCRICVALIPMDRVLTPELSRVQSCETINTIDKWQWQLQLAISIHCWLVFSEDGWVYHEQVRARDPKRLNVPSESLKQSKRVDELHVQHHVASAFKHSQILFNPFNPINTSPDLYMLRDKAPQRKSHRPPLSEMTSPCSAHASRPDSVAPTQDGNQGPGGGSHKRRPAARK